MSESHSLSGAETRGREPTLNALVLGAVYAAAVFFAIAFSPNMGFVAHPQPATRTLAVDLPAHQQALHR